MFERIVYFLLRSSHFLVVSTCLPAAFYYLRFYSDSPGSSAARLLTLLGAPLWALLYFGLHSYAYPVNARGAAVFSLGPIVNLCISGFTASNLIFGSYSVLAVSLTAQCLFLSGWLILSFFPENSYFSEWNLQTFDRGLLLSVSLPLYLLAFFMLGPLIKKTAFLNLSQSAPILFGFGSQIVSELWVLYKGSAINRNEQFESERNKIHNAWSSLTVVCITGSLCAYIFMAIWHS